MLTFQLDEGKQVHIERESIEEKILEGIFAKFEEAREKEPGMYNGFKQAVNMLKLVGGIKIDVPKGENTLEYLVAHFLGIGMDLLEAAPILVEGVVVQAPTAEPEETKAVEVK